jgi:predicted O-methyltransferase YrrM
VLLIVSTASVESRLYPRFALTVVVSFHSLRSSRYSFIRFTKVKKVCEIGAGYTSVWILQAMKDNDDEMKQIHSLQSKGQCRMLDIDWTIHSKVDSINSESSRLLCIDNCEHQKETATGARAVAYTLGLSDYFEFRKGDAFDLSLGAETMDLLWCDFGVGGRMKDFIASHWKSIRPGGYLICHSTMTNENTRMWLEAVRSRQAVESTGIPPDDYVELSLMEPHKRFQNSISILQKRRNEIGDSFHEPIYSQYA